MNGISQQEAANSLQNQLVPENWQKISNRTFTIDNTTAYETTYAVNDTHFSQPVKMVNIFLFKNGKNYVLMYQAPKNTFDQEKANFEFIVNSFKFQ